MKDSKVKSLIKEIRILEKEINLLNARVNKLETRLNRMTHESATIYDENVISNIPTCCKNCSNHPSNGGSGICHCTLPYFENPLKWGTYGVSIDFVKDPDICFDGTSNTYTYDKDSRWKYNINV